MAPLTLSQATKSDLRSIANLQYAAFHPHDTMHTLLYPSPLTPTSSVLENTVKRLTNAWETEPVTWVKVTDEATGELVAAAKWLIFKDEEPKWPENVDAEWINGEIDTDWVRPGGKHWEKDREYVNWVLTEWFGRRKERMRGALVLLDLCCTNPKYHRQGAGSQLVQWGVDRADELGLKAFVEASLTGRRLYESKGFVVNEEVCLVGGNKRDEWKDRGEIKYCFMEREAKSKGKA